MEDFIPLPNTEQFSAVAVSMEADKSLVPATLGNVRKPSNDVSTQTPGFPQIILKPRKH